MPSYRHHKASGQAIVVIDGKTHYLGKFNSPESKERYKELTDQLSTPPAGTSVTTAELIGLYLQWVESQHKGKAHEKSLTGRAFRSLSFVASYGSQDASKFGPRALKEVRQRMIQAKWSRKYINTCIGLIRRCWRWGVSEELVPVTSLHALETVAGLESGAPGVVETSPRLDVTWKQVEATLPELPTIVRAAVIVQWNTGARPNELLSMRWQDIDTSNPVWIYRPTTHKTAWRRQGREILIGPQAQSAMLPLRDQESFIFNPRKSVEEQWGQGAHLPGGRSAREKYSPESYARAIARACDRACVPHWSPYQIRHAFLTRIAAVSGELHAKMLGGQKSIQSLAVYNHHDLNALTELMKRVG